MLTIRPCKSAPQNVSLLRSFYFVQLTPLTNGSAGRHKTHTQIVIVLEGGKMPYSAEITRATPTCFVFLIDQSSSMHERIQGRADQPRKSEFITDALNKTIRNLI